MPQQSGANLNSEQKRAAHHIKGSLLVIAGAGSGKTRVITSRIAYLIQEHDVPAHAIIALTFTNKAANEMKERIAKMIGEDKELPFVGTFHSYCVRMLKKYSHLSGTPFISILDEDDKNKLLGGILKRNNLHKQLATRQAGYHISQMKNKNINLDKPANQLFDHPLMPDIFTAYEQEKREIKALDFDDLLLESVRLFKKSPDFKKEFQGKTKHILVDEYQDTNVVQHELLKHMALAGKKLALDSICAVGDEDQSIYSWRGATVTNMLHYQADFPKTTLIKIEQNYRSVQPILHTANHVIKHNSQRNDKKLWSEKKASDRIRLLTCMSEYQESDIITQAIKSCYKKDSKAEVAILYRTHTQSRAIEEALIKQSIAYRIFGGIQFYERKEIKDVIAYLKLIANPFDRVSFFRILNTPTRGFGAKFEESLFTIFKEEPFLTCIKACEKIAEQLTGVKLKQLKDFLLIFENIYPQDKPSRALDHVLKHTNYLAYLRKNENKEEAQARIDNVQELMDAIRHFEDNKGKTISEFLEDLALMQEKMKATDDEQNKVLLMTLHAAKGLEFDFVMLAGLEQGILPTARALYDTGDDTALEEERRLFYVGITRAKERLLLTNAKFRYTYGQMNAQTPSQFVDELPAKFVKQEDCSQQNSRKLNAYFAQWFGTKTEYSSEFYGRKNEFTSFIKDRIKPAKKTAPFASKASPAPAAKAGAPFKKNQPVFHKKYGTGLVQSIEKRNDKTFITVAFKIGKKKIAASFLKAI